jgi:hypothetical protein
MIEVNLADRAVQNRAKCGTIRNLSATNNL